MEITVKGMTAAKKSSNKSNYYYYDFLKKYPCIIYVKNSLKCELKKFVLE